MQLTYVILLQELLRVVVAVDVDLGNGIVDRGVLATSLHTRLKPRQNQLQPVARLNLLNKLVNGEVAGYRGQ